jgi:hypothetical protein
MFLTRSGRICHGCAHAHFESLGTGVIVHHGHPLRVRLTPLARTLVVGFVSVKTDGREVKIHVGPTKL